MFAKIAQLGYTLFILRSELKLNHNIIIIGPIRSGKSTICKKLSEKLQMNHVDMDELRSILYLEMGYSEEAADQEYSTKGIKGWYEYQKPFELKAVKTVIKNNNKAVIEFGGGQSVYEDDLQAQEFINLMRNEKFVFLLFPCSDKQKSLEILDERIGEEEAEKILNRIFINSQTNEQVAKFKIYTNGKTPDETIEEIISKYNNTSELKPL